MTIGWRKPTDHEIVAHDRHTIMNHDHGATVAHDLCAIDGPQSSCDRGHQLAFHWIKRLAFLAGIPL